MEKVQADSPAVPASDAAPSVADAAGRSAIPKTEQRRRALASRLFNGRGWKWLRLSVDSALLLLAPIAADIGAPDDIGPDGRTLIWLFPPMAIAGLALARMYSPRTQAKLIDGLGLIVAVTSLAAVSLIAGAAYVDPDSDPAPLIARTWLYGTALLIGGRLLLGYAQRHGRATRLVTTPTLIVGAGYVGALVELRLNTQPQLGLEPVGYLDADPPPAELAPDRQAPVLGGPDDIEEVIRRTGAKHVVFSFMSGPDRDLIPLMRRCEVLGLQVSFVPRFFEQVNVHLALEHLGGLPLFGLRPIDPKGWQFAIKHALDRAAASLMLFFLSPLLLALALATRISSPGPVLFKQLRVGRDGREFEMLKFRSMRLAPPEEQTLPGNVTQLPTDVGPGGVEGDDRRTAVGTLLRRTSLDELPQLMNVVRGDMSLVGPRPERPEFVEAFGMRIARYDDRHRVKSGITGWAQVNGLRGKTSLRDRVEWDNYYIENWSLSLDLKILLMTLSAVFYRAE